MQYVTSVVAAVALTSSITLAPMQASAAETNCQAYHGGEICHRVITPTVHRIGYQQDADNWVVLDVTCTDKQWIIHEGRYSGFTREERNDFALGFCESYGSMFSF